MVVYQPIPSFSNQLSELCQWNSGTRYTQNLSSQNYLSLLVTPEDISPNNIKPNQKQPLTNNIPPATVTNDKLLTAIFSFKLEKLTSTSLFSEVMLKEKPITTMYMDAKMDSHPIKLILNIDHTASTRIIMADKITKTPIGEIDNFPFEVNSIITPIKVLVMEATQYQALVGNDWLVKTNTMLD
ncbi:hypothetical protein G9A89_008760 [Geosiphon pyriformis]|nr:hypothetical protein G9A89_008760 [Geosiphon pyriformis]